MTTGWSDLPPGLRAALTEQWHGVGARALACGSAVTDRSGAVVAAGRNRAYDPVSGADPLEGTPLAHAELNALARVPTGTDTAGLTIWCTQRPCAMCATAIGFVGVGAVRHLAEDPSDAAQSDATPTRVGDPFWTAVTTALFLYSGFVLRGGEDRTLARHRAGWPALTRTVRTLATDDRLGEAARAGRSLVEVVADLDDALRAAAAELP